LEVILRDASELTKPSAEEAMAVLTAVNVNATVDESGRVIDDRVVVNPGEGGDSVVDRIVVSVQDHGAVTEVGDAVFRALKGLVDEEPNEASVTSEEG
jgi:hypothetical protein